MALVLLGLSGPAHAANIAGEGTAILGVHTTIDSTLGTPYGQFNEVFRLNDGDAAARGDTTWNGNQAHAGTHGFSYAGITWATPRTDNVLSLTITMATFFDGGWFGVNGQPSPAVAGDPLTASQLIAPTVQVLSGETWTTVAATSTYLSQFEGHTVGGGGNPNPTIRDATFTLDTPQAGITGIRLIGSEGGVASNGFIGVNELVVDARPIVPEPATTLLGMSGVALACLGRRRRER